MPVGSIRWRNLGRAAPSPGAGLKHSRLPVLVWCSTLPYEPGSSPHRNCGVDFRNAVDVGVLKRSSSIGGATAPAAGTSFAAFGAVDARAGSRRDRTVVFGGRIPGVSSRGRGGTCQDRERVPAVCFRCCRSSLYIPMGRNTAAAPACVCRRPPLSTARYAIGFHSQRTSQRPEIFVLLAGDNETRRTGRIATRVWRRKLLMPARFPSGTCRNNNAHKVYIGGITDHRRLVGRQHQLSAPVAAQSALQHRFWHPASRHQQRGESRGWGAAVCCRAAGEIAVNARADTVISGGANGSQVVH